jgi:protease I
MSQIKSLTSKKIAFLAANGFREQTLTLLQRAFMKEGGILRIVSPEAGLINGWNGENWGHHYAIDKNLGEALGSDYHLLIIPGGKRSIEKLNLTAHTKRFVNSFLASAKPIVALDEAVSLLINTENLADRTVTGPVELQIAAERAGVNWSEESVTIDGNIMTAVTAENDNGQKLVDGILDFFIPGSVEQAA